MSEFEENIPVEEEAVEDENGGKEWREEFKVSGAELVNVVKGLVHEATVRRIVVRNDRRNINLQIPLVAGLAGIALLPPYAALALIAALVADCTIEVIRREEKAAESNGPEMETAEA